MSAERDRVRDFGRLDLGLRQACDCYLWGPYLSERQWGTVRDRTGSRVAAWYVLDVPAGGTQEVRLRLRPANAGSSAGAASPAVPADAADALGTEFEQVTGQRQFEAYDVMSMPDKWEYQWFANWDLAFHCVSLVGDNGAGLGATQQTGWTGLVADLIRRRYGEVPSVADVIQRPTVSEDYAGSGQAGGGQA